MDEAVSPERGSDLRRTGLATLAVFAVALAMRWGHLAGLEAGLRGTHLFSIVRGDATLHWLDALIVLEGRWLPWDTVPWKGPGYTWFLATLMAAFGTSPGSLRWVLAALGALNCALLVLLARRIVTLPFSVLAGLLAATNGTLIFFDGELFFSTLLISLGLAVTWWVGVPRCNKGSAFAAGALSGFAALVHPAYLLATAAVGLWVGRRQVAAGSLFLFAAALVVAPVTLSNIVRAGQPVVISWNGGINLYVGNHPNFDAYSGNRTRSWSRILQSTADAGIERECDRDRVYYGLALRQLLEHPVLTAGVLLRKVGALLSPVEYANNVQIYEMRAYSPVLATTLAHLGPLWLPFGLLGPAALIGLLGRVGPFGSAGAAPQLRATQVWSAGIAASILVSFVTSRYRAPLEFFSCLWASLALAAFWAAWQAGDRRRLAGLAGGFALLAVLLAALAVPQRGFPLPLEWDEASVLAADGAFGPAQSWVDRALARAPDDPELLHAVAGFHARQGAREEERRYLERLLALPDLEPDMLAVGHELLARSFAHTGDLDAARREIAAARAVAADRAEWHGFPHYRLDLGPLADCWLRLVEAGIELDAGRDQAAAELCASVRRDCGEGGRLGPRLVELDVARVLERKTSPSPPAPR